MKKRRKPTVQKTFGVLALAALLALPGMTTPVQAGDFWKPFLGGVASGFVIHEASHVVFDADPGEALDAYLGQIRLYARAIATATGRPASGILLRI
jgi:hypothetical protein